MIKGKQTHSLFSTQTLTAKTFEGRGRAAEGHILFAMVSLRGKRVQGMLGFFHNYWRTTDHSDEKYNAQDDNGIHLKNSKGSVRYSE